MTVTIYPHAAHGWNCTGPEAYEARYRSNGDPDDGILVQICNDGEWQDWATIPFSFSPDARNNGWEIEYSAADHEKSAAFTGTRTPSFEL